jgi:tellurite resistance protein
MTGDEHPLEMYACCRAEASIRESGFQRDRPGIGIRGLAIAEPRSIGRAAIRAARYSMGDMQIDSPTIQRLRDMLQARAGLPACEDGSRGRIARDEASPEVRALVERVSPMCEVLYLTMVADDESGADEIESIRGAIALLTDGALSSETIESMLRHYAAAALEQGRAERLKHVAAQLSADREDAEAALVLAAAVAVADGSVAGAEERLLTELCGSLGISGARAAVVLDTSR